MQPYLWQLEKLLRKRFREEGTVKLGWLTWLALTCKARSLPGGTIAFWLHSIDAASDVTLIYDYAEAMLRGRRWLPPPPLTSKGQLASFPVQLSSGNTTGFPWGGCAGRRVPSRQALLGHESLEGRHPVVVVAAAVVGLATGQPAPASFVYLEGRRDRRPRDPWLGNRAMARVRLPGGNVRRAEIPTICSRRPTCRPSE